MSNTPISSKKRNQDEKSPRTESKDIKPFIFTEEYLNLVSNKATAVSSQMIDFLSTNLNTCRSTLFIFPVQFSSDCFQAVLNSQKIKDPKARDESWTNFFHQSLNTKANTTVGSVLEDPELGHLLFPMFNEKHNCWNLFQYNQDYNILTNLSTFPNQTFPTTLETCLKKKITNFDQVTRQFIEFPDEFKTSLNGTGVLIMKILKEFIGATKTLVLPECESLEKEQIAIAKLLCAFHFSAS